jgi:type IV secretory pathway VirB9-like protein
MSMFVITAVPYLSTRLIGCSLDPRTNNGTHKLSKHPSYKKKKKKFQYAPPTMLLSRLSNLTRHNLNSDSKINYFNFNDFQVFSFILNVRRRILQVWFWQKNHYCAYRFTLQLGNRKMTTKKTVTKCEKVTPIV